MKKIAAAVAVLGFAVFAAPPAHADTVFTMCPDGHEGVVGGHTSCEFAQIVRNGYFLRGPNFAAYSPVTDQWYDIACLPGARPAYFADGSERPATSCYTTESNAEVVVW